MAGINTNAYGNLGMGQPMPMNNQMMNMQNTGMQTNNYGQMPITTPVNMGYNQIQGLSIAQVNGEGQVNNYPVAAGNTVILIDFNSHWFAIKSTNFNGVPMPIQWCDYTERVNTRMQQNVQMNANDQNMVTREEFNELKSMLSQALYASQNTNRGSNNNHNNRDRRNGQNVQSNDAPANNG